MSVRSAVPSADIPPVRVDGETLATHGDVTAMAYHRAARADRPLVVFLPGACHLARIAYGTANTDRRDFLDYWLEQEDCGLLALSYPTDHPSVGSLQSDLTIRRWADWIVSAIASCQRPAGSEIIVTMWSMAGRSAHAINASLIDKGIGPARFISLAATPPLPGLIPVTEGGEPLAPNGFWAVRSNKFLDDFHRAITLQSQIAGRQILSADEYRDNFLCATPIMLRGTAQRWHGGKSGWSEIEAAADIGGVPFETLPLTGTIVPGHQSDMAHVLGDRFAWGHLGIQKLVSRVRRSAAVSEAQWQAVTALFADAGRRLSADIRGGHFFFLGEPGASATARLILSLGAELRAVERELSEILDDPNSADFVTTQWNKSHP